MPAKKVIKEYGGKETYKNAKAKALHEKKESKKTEMKEKKGAPKSPAKKCGCGSPMKMKKKC